MTSAALIPGHFEGGIGVRQFIQPLLLRTECASTASAWKCSRVLSGFLASTAHSSDGECPSWQNSRQSVLTRIHPVGHHGGRDLWVDSIRTSRRRFTHVGHCGASEEQLIPSENITPVTLWESLKPTISYLSVAQLSMVKDALKLAFEAHNGQKRKSGEPYIIHPVEVARILGEYEMDWETIVAGLLHDTVEDTEHVTFEKIEDQFGPAVRRIVEGETKVSKLGKMKCQDADLVARDVKADDLRQMFLAMTEEVRVIIVKLADRLHNMRTLTHMSPHKQRYIAMETLQVFAPLARLLGMYRIKSELEDLSFMFAHPEEYLEVKHRVQVLCKEQEEVVLEAKKVLLQTILKDQFLSYMTLDVKVVIVCKELYSIFKKMQETKCSADEIRDIAQLRIILRLKSRAMVGPLCNAQQVCYHVLGLVHAMWPPVPQTMKDYIATPKPNGYQSLHTTLIPFGSKTFFPLEIQIRTDEMDKLAEWGIAAHHSGKWSIEQERDAIGPFGLTGAIGTVIGSLAGYKPPQSRGWSNCLNDADIARRVSWLNSIREWQEEFVGNMTSREFVDTITGDLLGSRVFVFTPKGEVKNLPKGATVIDYAYQIHTDVGNKMVAAKVNGNLVSPTHVLANAEVVEILTYDGVSNKKVFQLHRQWLQFARTRSARHKLTKFLKEQAAISAAEITAETVKDFVADVNNEDGEVTRSSSGPGLLASSTDSNGKPKNRTINEPFAHNSYLSKVLSFEPRDSGNGALNGKHSKVEGNGSARGGATSRFQFIQYDAKATIEAWQTERILLWHSAQGGSVQWFSVCCHDRTSILADVTAVLGATGVRICSCVAETDRARELGIMLFQIEGGTDSLVQACAKVALIDGVLDWSIGCSWQSSHTFRRRL
ncbi:hypothetical protein CY35_01G097300 [Sphagnum magellanicum]|nr:hypothetical protein CY35_01G097300 [Sphagnum magellanicum]